MGTHVDQGIVTSPRLATRNESLEAMTPQSNLSPCGLISVDGACSQVALAAQHQPPPESITEQSVVFQKLAM